MKDCSGKECIPDILPLGIPFFPTHTTPPEVECRSKISQIVQNYTLYITSTFNSEFLNFWKILDLAQ